jgi:hypothetical protein
VLLVIDEAPGVRPDTWEAIEGIRAGGDVRVLALGNPTVSSGPFYDAFTAHRSGWSTFTIGAFDSPNLAGLSLEQLLTLADAELDRNVRAYLVTRRWVRDKHAEWGVDHPLWAARVLGQFPVQGDDALISLTWLEEAARRPARDAGGPVTAGLDVAGPGDDETVLVIAEGPRVLVLRAWSEPDPRGAVVACLNSYRHRLDVVNVDAAGLGYYLGKHLEDLGFPVRLVNVGESPSQPDRYRNLKAELYWSLRLRFQGGDVAGLTDERTIGQLAGILYRHTARGQVEIESKETARKRGVKSPDRAEAVTLAFARVTSTQLLWGQEVDHGQRPLGRDGYAAQIADSIEDMGWGTRWAEDQPTCASCCHFQASRGRCALRDFDVAPSLPGCDFYDVVLSQTT